MSIWSFPTKIVFGAGEISRLGVETAALGVKRVLVVADPGVERTGLLKAPLASLNDAGLVTSVFTGVDGNPTEQNIEDGAKAYAAHQAEGVACTRPQPARSPHPRREARVPGDWPPLPTPRR